MCACVREYYIHSNAFVQSVTPGCESLLHSCGVRVCYIHSNAFVRSVTPGDVQDALGLMWLDGGRAGVYYSHCSCESLLHSFQRVRRCGWMARGPARGCLKAGIAAHALKLLELLPPLLPVVSNVVSNNHPISLSLP